MDPDLEIRNDFCGRGAWGAPRGDRPHLGVDYIAKEGTHIYAPHGGVIAHVGYAYSKDKYKYTGRESLRTIWLQTPFGRWKFLYLQPRVRELQEINRGTIIGTMTNMAQFYESGMTNHIHVELWVNAFIDHGIETSRDFVPIDPHALLRSAS